MNLLLVLLLVQSLLLPPRYAMENPAAVSSIPKKLKNDYDKLWTRFTVGNDDARVLADVDKILKKQKNFDAGMVVQAYIHLYKSNAPEAANRFEQALAINPYNRIAIYYLAELAFARGDYARASDMSNCQLSGSLRMTRPALPRVPRAGCPKAAGFKYWLRGRPDSSL